MIRFPFFLAILISLSLNSFAQNSIKDILDNPEVSWAAETYTIYAPNIHHFDQDASTWIAGTNAPSTLKILNNIDDNQLEIASTLAYHVLNLKQEQLNLFNDAELSKKITFKDYNNLISSTDTIDTFDSETFEKKKQAVTTKHDYSFIRTFKVKQILFYNSKTHLFGLKPIAIAPIYDNEALFWIPIQDLKKSLDLSSSTIVWAKRIVRDIHQKDLTIIKGKQTLGEIIMDLIGYCNITPEFSKLYFTSSPLKLMHTNEIKLINKGIAVKKATDFTQIRIVQDWYWDNEIQQISAVLHFYAPIMKYHEEVTNRTLEDPFFYQKP